MKRTFVCVLLFPLFLLAGSAAGQSASIHQQIQQTYNFQPHRLSNQEITKKSAVTDLTVNYALGVEFEVDPSRPGSSRSTYPATADMIDPAMVRNNDPA